jgi:predicted regulator of Ras-like GTPase activity (Roadblock/LC7/MglB family)
MDQQDLVSQLARVPGVAGAVIVTTDGMVLGHNLPGDVERHAAVAALLGAMAAQIGDTLHLGTFRAAGVETASGNMLVLERPDCYVGLVLEESATATAVAMQARRILD